MYVCRYVIDLIHIFTEVFFFLCVHNINTIIKNNHLTLKTLTQNIHLNIKKCCYCFFFYGNTKSQNCP